MSSRVTQECSAPRCQAGGVGGSMRKSRITTRACPGYWRWAAITGGILRFTIALAIARRSSVVYCTRDSATADRQCRGCTNRQPDRPLADLSHGDFDAACEAKALTRTTSERPLVACRRGFVLARSDQLARPRHHRSGTQQSPRPFNAQSSEPTTRFVHGDRRYVPQVQALTQAAGNDEHADSDFHFGSFHLIRRSDVANRVPLPETASRPTDS